MKKIILLIAVTASFLLWAGISVALTLDQAIADIDRQVVEKDLSPTYVPMAVSAFERLTAKGVTVDNVYLLVDASMNSGVGPHKLLRVILFINWVSPEKINAATEAAASAITSGYSTQEVVDVVREWDNPVPAQGGE